MYNKIEYITTMDIIIVALTLQSFESIITCSTSGKFSQGFFNWAISKTIETDALYANSIFNFLKISKKLENSFFL